MLFDRVCEFCDDSLGLTFSVLIGFIIVCVDCCVIQNNYIWSKLCSCFRLQEKGKLLLLNWTSNLQQLGLGSFVISLVGLHISDPP